MKAMDRYSRHLLLVIALGACACLRLQPAAAQSLEEQYVYYLISACNNLNFARVPDQFGDPIIVAPGQAGPELTAYCSRPAPVAGPGDTQSATTSAGTAGSAADQALRRRQASLRKGEEAATQGPDEFGILSSGATSLFASFNYAREDQQARRFEGGRRADQLALALGLDRRLGAAGVAGIAAAIEDQSGDLDAGGSADYRGYSALLYGSWTPGPALFVDFNGGFTARNTSTSRTVTFLRTQPQEFIAPARAHSKADQQEWRGALLAGSDFAYGRNSFGPRLAVEYRRSTLDGYTETGSSAMALVIEEQVEKSLRGGVGLQGSRVMNAGSAVWVLQLNTDWWHEFEDDQRFISARLAQDLRANPVRFRYQNQPPDRDVFAARMSLSATMPHGFSAFVSVDGLFGHSYLNRYGVALGLRKEL
jgi:outer membrane autotransporter protein